MEGIIGWIIIIAIFVGFSLFFNWLGLFDDELLKRLSKDVSITERQKLLIGLTRKLQVAFKAMFIFTIILGVVAISSLFNNQNNEFIVSAALAFISGVSSLAFYAVTKFFVILLRDILK